MSTTSAHFIRGIDDDLVTLDSGSKSVTVKFKTLFYVALQIGALRDEHKAAIQRKKRADWTRYNKNRAKRVREAKATKG